jgi:23S rRNA (guanosine2251-2'-O)-methyltransferase
MELLQERSSSVERVCVAIGRKGGLGRLLRTAREAGVPVSHLEKDALQRKLGVAAVHQGVAAVVAIRPYEHVRRVCAAAEADPDGMLVLVDRVVDPRNLGAILRTSAAAGVRGVIVGSEGTVGLTPAASKVAAGALERVAVARDPKPARLLRTLRSRGFSAVGLDPRSGEDWDRLDLGGRIIVVAGGEERGPTPGVLRACNHRVTLPMASGVESLNVAVALGVLLFEAVRQRRAGRAGS